MRKRKRVEEIFGWLNRGRYAQNKTSGHPSRGLDVYLLPGRLQSGQNATDGARSISSKADLRPLSVFRPQTPQ